jgi:hypothetical protein
MQRADVITSIDVVVREVAECACTCVRGHVIGEVRYVDAGCARQFERIGA